MKMDFYSRLLFWAIIILIHSSCDSQGHRGVSNNIKESKRRNIFISQYELSPNPYVINDTLKMEVISAWVEYQWAYGKFDDETIILKDQYQLIMITKGNILEDYNATWSIGIDGDRYIRSCGRNCLMSDFTQMPKDMEEWKVQSGGELDSLSEKTIIGTFRVIKKGN